MPKLTIDIKIDGPLASGKTHMLDVIGAFIATQGYREIMRGRSQLKNGPAIELATFEKELPNV